MPRIDPLPRSQASADIAEHYDRVFGKGRDPVAEPGTATGTPGNWHAIWARVPGILKAFSAYGMANAKLAPKLREIAILRTGYLCESQFVFSQHSKAARNNGVDAERIASIACWQIADCFTAEERAVLAYTDSLILQHGRVHVRVVDALKASIGAEGVLELGYFVKAYDMHASNCRSLRLEYDDVPDRIAEIPVPESPGVRDWHDPSWAKTADQG